MGKHYNYICKKISQKIRVLKYVRDYVKFDILKMVYSSIVLPHMDYASIVWGRWLIMSFQITEKISTGYFKM